MFDYSAYCPKNYQMINEKMSFALILGLLDIVCEFVFFISFHPVFPIQLTLWHLPVRKILSSLTSDVYMDISIWFS